MFNLPNSKLVSSQGAKKTIVSKNTYIHLSSVGKPGLTVKASMPDRRTETRSQIRNVKKKECEKKKSAIFKQRLARYKRFQEKKKRIHAIGLRLGRYTGVGVGVVSALGATLATLLTMLGVAVADCAAEVVDDGDGAEPEPEPEPEGEPMLSVNWVS